MLMVNGLLHKVLAKHQPVVPRRNKNLRSDPKISKTDAPIDISVCV